MIAPPPLPECLMEQPLHTLFPTAQQFSNGFGESSWRRALQASNDHLIPRSLTLGVHMPATAVEGRVYLRGLLAGLRLHAGWLAPDREVVAVVLRPGVVDQLPPAQLEQLLDAVPQVLRTVPRAPIEATVDAGSRIASGQLRAVGITRLCVRDRAGADGPAVLARAQQDGFAACSYQLRAPDPGDDGFLERLRRVIGHRPARIVLPSPGCACGVRAAGAWLAAWQQVVGAGYAPMGGEHYQRNDLEPPPHGSEGERYCDLAGVPRRERTDFIGLGADARSQVGGVLCRMEADPLRWQARVDEGHAGVVAGVILSDDEMLSARAAQRVACDHRFEVADFQWRSGVEVSDAFPDLRARLAPHVARQWAGWHGGTLHLRAEGILLWRIIAACFHPMEMQATPQD